jgi:RNA polymerase sigma factor (sigma-70 family)
MPAGRESRAEVAVRAADDASEFERARRREEERPLVEAAIRGSAAAFEALYRLHVGHVHGLCLRMTAHPATAEDCTQETFVQAWRSLPSFGYRSAFGTWLHRIAVNAVLAHGRRRREATGADRPIDEVVADTLADPSLGEDAAVIDLEEAIRRLPPGARDVLVLTGIYGYSHEEAAAMLGLAVGTCKSQLHRARRLLGERLALEEEP